MKKTKTIPSSLREEVTQLPCDRCGFTDPKHSYSFLVAVTKKDIKRFILCSTCVKEYLKQENLFKLSFMKGYHE